MSRCCRLTHLTSWMTPRDPPKTRTLRTSPDTSKTVPRLCLNEVCSSRNGSSGGIFRLSMPFPNFGIISFIASLMHSSRCGLSIWHVIVPDAVNRERSNVNRFFPFSNSKFYWHFFFPILLPIIAYRIEFGKMKDQYTIK